MGERNFLQKYIKAQRHKGKMLSIFLLRAFVSLWQYFFKQRSCGKSVSIVVCKNLLQKKSPRKNSEGNI